MYRIIKTDGTELGITDTTKDNAIGVAFNSEPYNLYGHSDIENVDTVIVSKIDGGAAVFDITNTISALLGVNE